MKKALTEKRQSFTLTFDPKNLAMVDKERYLLDVSKSRVTNDAVEFYFKYKDYTEYIDYLITLIEKKGLNFQDVINQLS